VAILKERLTEHYRRDTAKSQDVEFVPADPNFFKVIE
jgi:hypothetical protein